MKRHILILFALTVSLGFLSLGGCKPQEKQPDIDSQIEVPENEVNIEPATKEENAPAAVGDTLHNAQGYSVVVSNDPPPSVARIEQHVESIIKDRSLERISKPVSTDSTQGTATWIKKDGKLVAFQHEGKMNKDGGWIKDLFTYDPGSGKLEYGNTIYNNLFKTNTTAQYEFNISVYFDQGKSVTVKKRVLNGPPGKKLTYADGYLDVITTGFRPYDERAIYREKALRAIAEKN